MNDKELFRECVKRMEKYGISILGYVVYSHNGTKEEFSSEGYNLGYNLARLGDVLNNEADFS